MTYTAAVDFDLLSTHFAAGADLSSLPAYAIQQLQRRGLVSTGSGSGATAVGKNLAFNSNFRLNQRAYVSATDIALNAYAFDRWKATTASSRMTFTAAPQGQQVTIASGDSFGQVLERADVPAGTYVLSWTGTATGRVYNVGGSAPALAASGLTVVIDGTADVLLEFGPGTLSNVKFELGSTPTTYEAESATDELDRCWRYYWRRTADATATGPIFGTGVANSNTSCFFPVEFPVKMRTTPTLAWNSLSITNGIAATVTPSAMALVATQTNAERADLLSTNPSFSTGTLAFLTAGSSSGYVAFDAEL